MKILKSLNKKFFLIIIILFYGYTVQAEEQPIDIWNIDKKTDENSIKKKSIEKNVENNQKIKSIYKIGTEKKLNDIILDEDLASNKIKIIGIYDPDDNGLDINLWSNSDGDQLKNIFKKLNNINLSTDASEIVQISILTNAYYPNKNITEKEFSKFKSEWMIKNSELDLIEEYYLKNQIINIHPNLIRYLVDDYLSEANVKKACEILFKNSEPINDDYLSKFYIYCLIINDKKDQAQLIYDLKKELGFKDEYFEKKIDFLLGFEKNNDKKISEKNLLNFHLAHKTTSNFKFEPKDSTKKIIWKYLTSSNLLDSFKEIDISDLKKISNIESAVHNKNYPEKDLFELYKGFQFNINQLLNADEAYKSLSSIEARALIYQKILIVSELEEKLRLLKILKNLFEKENIGNAFDTELKKFLQKMDPLNIPDNLTSFYYTNIQIEKNENLKIKFNNDVLHQSKLINYFNGDYSKSKIEKDLNKFLSKIMKNKKYFISKNDIIFIESLRSDGIKIEKKYDNLYKMDISQIPSDIQIMINNDEKGTALLRIAEVIGQDDLERIDEDTMFFIITTLNKLGISQIRNKILLKVLPLKV